MGNSFGGEAKYLIMQSLGPTPQGPGCYAITQRNNLQCFSILCIWLVFEIIGIS